MKKYTRGSRQQDIITSRLKYKYFLKSTLFLGVDNFQKHSVQI